MYRQFVLLLLLVFSYVFGKSQMPPADTSQEAYFHRLYDYNALALFHSITGTFDNKLIVCGNARFLRCRYGSPNATIAKLENNGNVIWSKIISGNNYNYEEFNRARENRDKSIIAVGTTNFANEIAMENMLITKLNADGNPLWSQIINTPDCKFPSWEATDVAETIDSGYFVCGIARNVFSPYSEHGILLKTDANGRLLWCRELGMPHCLDRMKLTNIVLHNDTAYVTGSISTDSAWIDDGLLVKMNANTGGVYWSKQYNYKQTDTVTGNLVSSNNSFKGIKMVKGQLRITMEPYVNKHAEVWMINMDGEGQVLKTRKVTSLYDPIGCSTADDGFIAASIDANYENFLLAIVKVDAEGNLAWSKSYKFKSRANIRTVATYINSNNEIFVTGYEAIDNAFDPYYTFICKIGKNGEMPGGFCNDIPATVGTGNLSVADISWELSGYIKPTSGRVVRPLVVKLPELSGY